MGRRTDMAFYYDLVFWSGVQDRHQVAFRTVSRRHSGCWI